MSNPESVKKWRKATKERIVASMGGKCQICGYSKCHEALELHHINPEEKEFQLGKIMANPISWDRIVVELRKCIMLCANCHREVHNDSANIPETYQTFSELYANYKQPIEDDNCPCCGKRKNIKNKFCSLSCAGKNKNKIDWKSVDLISLVAQNGYAATGRLLGVTGAAVKKQYKKLFPN